MKTPVVAALMLAVVAAATGGYWLGGGRFDRIPSREAAPRDTNTTAPPAKAAAAPAAVEVSAVEAISLPQTITAVGSLRSDESVMLRPEIAGRITAILFKEGEPVRKGQTLVKLDAAIPAAELRQAKANLTLAEARYRRTIELAERNFLSAQAKDDARNNLEVAQAALAMAQAKLEQMEIPAPFSGIIGLRVVSVGDYVKGGADLVNLESIDPLKVDFRVPEIHLKDVAVGQSVQVELDALPGRGQSGRVIAVNPLVDAAGRSIVIRAQVSNPGTVLRPGMFARVTLVTRDTRPSLMIPEEAIVPQGTDQFVFRVEKNRVTRIRVETGQRRAAKVEIVKGLAAGDTVVTAGQARLRDGATVTIASASRSASKQTNDGAVAK